MEIDIDAVVAEMHNLEPDLPDVFWGRLDVIVGELRRVKTEFLDFKLEVAIEAERVGRLARGSKPEQNHRA